METIEHKVCADWPLLPPERRRRGRRVVSQAQRRIGWHYLGWVDPERVRLVNCMIGHDRQPVGACIRQSERDVVPAAFLQSADHQVPGKRRGDLAELRAELNELRRTISVR